MIYQNITAQQAILSILLLHPEIADKVFWETKEEMFSGINRDIYSHMKGIIDTGQKLTLMAIEKKDYVQHLTDWCSNIGFYHPDNLNIIAGTLNPYIETLYRKWKEAKRKSIANEIAKNNSSENIESMMQEYLSLETVSDNSFKHISEIIDEFSTEEKYRQMTQSVIKTDWPGFDNDVIIKNGDLIILGARPSMGKTDIVLQMGKRVSKNKSVGIFSLEMKGEYLNKRLAGGGNSFEIYKSECEKLINLKIYINDSPAQSIRSIRQNIKKAINDFNIKIAVIDYLTLMETEKQETRNREIEELVKGLKQSAREFDIPIVVLAQLNRAAEARTDKKPQLSDLRDSGSIEQNVDIVLFLWRPDYYGLNSESPKLSYLPIDCQNYMEMFIAKQRDGKTGILKFYYNTQTKIIEEWQENYTDPVIDEQVGF